MWWLELANPDGSIERDLVGLLCDPDLKEYHAAIEVGTQPSWLKVIPYDEGAYTRRLHPTIYQPHPSLSPSDIPVRPRGLGHNTRIPMQSRIPMNRDLWRFPSARLLYLHDRSPALASDTAEPTLRRMT